MKTLISMASAALAATVVSTSAWAHHGWSSYDANKAVKIEAPVAEVRWRNPHAEIDISYQGETWDVVLAPLGRLESRGLPEQALTKGKTVTVEGYPRQDGTREIRAERITVDGKTIELR
ncbi:DUF6152 family protein [Bordetella genomosp. 13]|uniref:DUF5666 domain-containing protein n=1 Tax=Bordetella genomosp. 13 TaxID=463040 RepID=A0A1W6Z8H0_9BORD|nr:DUF6152 family protein [Bordetella genomosp. 13]ARP93542.1 hypothetical protein CAL15_03585 [Bordetella genomosp. 13]